MTAPLDSLVTQFEIDAGIQHQLIHGDESTVVELGGVDVPSHRKAISDLIAKLGTEAVLTEVWQAATAAEVAFINSKRAAADAETARDAAQITANITDTIAAGIALSAATTGPASYFAVRAGGPDNLPAVTLYRRTSSTTHEFVDTISTGALKNSLSKTETQYLGRPVTPVDGHATSGATVILADPIKITASLQSFGLFVKAPGTLAIATYSKSGTTLMRTGLVTVNLSELGYRLLTSEDFGEFPVAVGEYIGLSGTGLWTYTPSIQADGLGWWNAANYPGAPSSVTIGAVNTTDRLEISITFEYSIQVVTTEAFNAVQASIVEKVNAATLAGRGTHTIGRPVTPADGRASTNSTVIFIDPIQNTGTLQSFGLFVKATGTLAIATYSKSGTTLTRTGFVTVNLSELGYRLLTSEDFGEFPVAAGEYIGLYGTGLWTFTPSIPADGLGWWNVLGNIPSTATIASTWSINRLEISIEVAYQKQVVTAEAFQSLENSVKSLNASPAARQYFTASSNLPILYISDGNSLTAGYKSSPPYLWSTGVADSLNVESYNFGVPNQTTQQMIIDAQAQIDPYAATPGMLPILIAQEMYNDIAQHNLTVSQAVTNMQMYCNARRAAGFIVGVCNLGDMATHLAFDNSMIETLNAELQARWWTFADFIVDMHAAPELRDRTNLTYFNADQIHCTNLGYSVMSRQARFAIRQWLMSR